VENSVQLKKSVVQSNRIGLQNIMMKYQLLGQPSVVVKHTDDTFLVSLPLLTPGAETPVGTLATAAVPRS
jgi:hypothetical protein